MTHHETTEEPIRRRRIVELRLRSLYKVGLVELWASGSQWSSVKFSYTGLILSKYLEILYPAKIDITLVYWLCIFTEDKSHMIAPHVIWI